MQAKTALWRTLQAVADADPRLDAARFGGLLDRAARQSDVLEDLRAGAVRQVFCTG